MLAHDEPSHLSHGSARHIGDGGVLAIVPKVVFDLRRNRKRFPACHKLTVTWDTLVLSQAGEWRSAETAEYSAQMLGAFQVHISTAISKMIEADMKANGGQMTLAFTPAMLRALVVA